jgi:ATP-binding cassette subfamily B protein
MIELAWPPSRIAEAVTSLAVATGLSERGDAVSLPQGAAPADDVTTEHLLAATAVPLGVEVEQLETTYVGVPALLRGAAPLLVRLPEGAGFLALVRANRRTAQLLGPDQRIHRVATREIVAALRGALIAGDAARDVDQVLDAVGFDTARRAQARSRLLETRLAGARVRGVWLLRQGVWTSFPRALVRAGVLRRALTLIATHLLGTLAMLGAWAMLAAGALSGRADPGWLAAWVLLLITALPCRAAVMWLQADLTARAGALLKRRLLVGALRIDPDALRAEGAGQSLGRAIEAVALEELLLGGGLVGLFAVVEVVVSVWLLGAGAGGALHVALFAVVAIVGVRLGAALYTRQRAWTDARLEMTHDVVEQMVGHRTRLIQQSVMDWHGAEDAAVAHAVRLMRRMDRVANALRLLPHIWLLVSLVGFAPGFIGGGASPESLAVAVAGVLYGSTALAKLVDVATDVAGAAIAWRRVAPVFHAAAREPACGAPDRVLAGAPSGGAAVDAHRLTYTHQGRAEPVFRALSLRIDPGERVLLEGPSGGGKSTLAALIAGLRRPAEGLLLAGGLDLPTLGDDGWRRRVVLAPQFHENHMVTETLAFNLLLGREWPPGPTDMREVDEVCKELGLGPLLERMPAGLWQMVGEGGWQLSHGERSRVFLARALLQRADVVILDESFGALDPSTMRQAVACARKRARTLLIISHA